MKFAITGNSLRPEDELGLAKNGFKTIKIPPCKTIDGIVSTHADTVLFFLRDRLFLPRAYYEENCAVIDRILDVGNLVPIFTESLPRSPYPYDVPLCALNASGNAIIACKKHLAPEIAVYCEENGIPLCNTRQGYAKCTSAYAGGIISADRSTLSAADKNGIPSLEISAGHVLLDGYDYGFIGGASGFDSKNLYFCGDLNSHPDGARIREFCALLGVGCVSLSSLPLYDIGSIFFI